MKDEMLDTSSSFTGAARVNEVRIDRFETPWGSGIELVFTRLGLEVDAYYDGGCRIPGGLVSYAEIAEARARAWLGAANE